jgi:biopolymer transport protein ExbD
VSGSVQGEIKAEPNLTPLLDVVFQLITFFMLVINFSADTYDQRIRLPIAATASPPEPGKSLEEDRRVLNIDKDGKLIWNGEILDSQRTIREIKVQAQIIRSDLERVRKKKGAAKSEDDTLPTTIVLRSDKETTYQDIYRIITACQANGFRKFSLKAMNGEN